MTTRKYVLSGLKVLDLSRYLQANSINLDSVGPFCSMMLADHGAQVIKVQNPRTNGDQARQWGPPFLKDGNACYFGAVNHTKKSVALDFKNKYAIQAIKDLARQSDVVIENYKPGKLSQFGIGYPELKAINPKLIYCEMSGYGSKGPLSKTPAFDTTMQAFSGIMSVTGYKDQPPVKLGFPVTDILAAYVSYGSILQALLFRSSSGKGQKIQTSLFQSALFSAPNITSGFLNNGVLAERAGNSHPQLCPYGVYQSKDGVQFMLGTACDSLVDKMVQQLNFQMKQQHRTNSLRVVDSENFQKLFQSHLLKFTMEELSQKFDRIKVPYNFINSIKDCIEHQHTKQLGLVVKEEDGEDKHISHPALFSEIDTVKPTRVPFLGEHSREVLSKICNYDDNMIDLALQVVQKKHHLA